MAKRVLKNDSKVMAGVNVRRESAVKVADKIKSQQFEVSDTRTVIDATTKMVKNTIKKVGKAAKRIEQQNGKETSRAYKKATKAFSELERDCALVTTLFKEVEYQNRETKRALESIYRQRKKDNSKPASYLTVMPTGSGKSYCMFKLFTNYGRPLNQYSSKQYLIDDKVIVLAFTLSNSDLNRQLYNSFRSYGCPSVLTKGAIETGSLLGGYVYTIGWDEIIKCNNILTFDTVKKAINKATVDGYKVLLIVDETHSYREYVEELYTLNVDAVAEYTATPCKSEHTWIRWDKDVEGIPNFSEVSMQECIAAGLLKSEIAYNDPLFVDKQFVSEHEDSEDVVLKHLIGALHAIAIKAIEYLALLSNYSKEYTDIKNPLTIITLPNANSNNSDDKYISIERKTAENIIAILMEYGVRKEQIAVKLSEYEFNTEGLTSPDSDVLFVITKECFKEGWDCPRCLGLLKLRNDSTSFADIQRIGRLMRAWFKNVDFNSEQFRALPEEIQEALTFLNKAYIVSDNKEHSKMTYNAYGFLAKGALETKRCTEMKKLSTAEIEAWNTLVSNVKDTKDVRVKTYAETAMYLSNLSNKLVDFYISHSLPGLGVITNKSDLQQVHKDNLAWFKSYGYIESNNHVVKSGVSTDGDFKHMKDTQNIVLNMQQEVSDKELTSALIQIGYPLNLSSKSTLYLMHNMFAANSLVDGDKKLLFIKNKYSLYYFIVANVDKLKSWTKQYAYAQGITNIAAVTSKPFAINVLASAFAPGNIDESYGNIEKYKPYAKYAKEPAVNNLYEDCTLFNVVKGNNYIGNQSDFLYRIMRKDRNMTYLGNIEKGKPGLGIIYKVKRVYKATSEMDLNKCQQVIKEEELHTYYPDWLGIYRDTRTKTIYVWVYELKNEISNTWSEKVPDKNLDKKFLALCEFVKWMADNNKNEDEQVWKLKYSAGIIRPKKEQVTVDGVLYTDSYWFLPATDENNVHFLNNINSCWRSVNDYKEFKNIVCTECMG